MENYITVEKDYQKNSFTNVSWIVSEQEGHHHVHGNPRNILNVLENNKQMGKSKRHRQ